MFLAQGPSLSHDTYDLTCFTNLAGFASGTDVAGWESQSAGGKRLKQLLPGTNFYDFYFYVYFWLFLEVFAMWYVKLIKIVKHHATNPKTTLLEGPDGCFQRLCLKGMILVFKRCWGAFLWLQLLTPHGFLFKIYVLRIFENFQELATPHIAFTYIHLSLHGYAWVWCSMKGCFSLKETLCSLRLTDPKRCIGLRIWEMSCHTWMLET